MGTIELKTETITVEIFVLTYNRAELEDIVSDPQPWVRELRAVLNGAKVKPIKDKPAAAKKSKPAPSPVSKAKRGGSKMPHASGGAGVGVAVKPLLYCQHCGAQFITPGRHANHEANCIDNPVNHKSAAEE